jgi:hypothetical protein
MKWLVIYNIGNTYKHKFVIAENSVTAIKKARVKNIIDLYPVDENNKKI